jgi:hypothetical protein
MVDASVGTFAVPSPAPFRHLGHEAGAFNPTASTPPHVGAKFAVAVNSCTAAMHLSLEAIGLQAGDLNNEWSQLQTAVRDLEDAAHAGETRAIHQVLRSLNIGYHNAYMPRETPIQLPQLEMVDRMASKQHPSAHLGPSAGKA